MAGESGRIQRQIEPVRGQSVRNATESRPESHCSALTTLSPPEETSWCPQRPPPTPRPRTLRGAPRGRRRPHDRGASGFLPPPGEPAHPGSAPRVTPSVPGSPATAILFVVRASMRHEITRLSVVPGPRDYMRSVGVLAGVGGGAVVKLLRGVARWRK